MTKTTITGRSTITRLCLRRTMYLNMFSRINYHRTHKSRPQVCWLGQKGGQGSQNTTEQHMCGGDCVCTTETRWQQTWHAYTHFMSVQAWEKERPQVVKSLRLHPPLLQTNRSCSNVCLCAVCLYISVLHVSRTFHQVRQRVLFARTSLGTRAFVVGGLVGMKPLGLFAFSYSLNARLPVYFFSLIAKWRGVVSETSHCDKKKLPKSPRFGYLLIALDSLGQSNRVEFRPISDQDTSFCRLNIYMYIISVGSLDRV